MAFPILKTGCKAYYDSFGGTVACVVTHIEGASGRASTDQIVTVRITATKHRAYKKGESVITSGLHVLPRECLRRRRYSSTIRPYDVACDIEHAPSLFRLVA